MDARMINYFYYIGFFVIAIGFYLESFVFPPSYLKRTAKTLIIIAYIVLGSVKGII